MGLSAHSTIEGGGFGWPTKFNGSVALSPTTSIPAPPLAPAYFRQRQLNHPDAFLLKAKEDILGSTRKLSRRIESHWSGCGHQDLLSLITARCYRIGSYGGTDKPVKWI